MDGYSQTPKEERINALRALMPEAFTEGKIDFKKLRATLGDGDVNPPNERYMLNWVGKSDAFRVMQLPSSETLVPCHEESVDFDTTQNLFIEGENMEVLKILQRSYFAKVKMIYIDPPYNTGSDSFIYPDKFSESKDQYLRRVGDKNEEGYMTREGLFQKNSKENGQYHSNWLSMMMPRLYLAKSLLREDGVIFISIDDNEVYNLRLLMNEIFGEENFEGSISWRRRTNQPNDATKMIATVSETILVYAKNSETLKSLKTFYKVPISEKRLSEYTNPDNDPRGPWSSKPWRAGKGQGGSSYEIITPKGIRYYEVWMGEKETFDKLVSEKKIIFPRNGRGKPRKKIYKEERIEEGQPAINFWFDKQYGDNLAATAELKHLFGKENLFSHPKPVNLLKTIARITTSNDDIILDFFAGSCTTAHAVMQLNKEDGGHRKFIMVQLPEKCDEKSDAFKAGFKNICEIGKERIRRAGAQIRETIEAGQKKQETQIAVPDLGFKVFKQQESNFKEWRKTKGSDKEVWKQQLIDFQDPVAPNATTGSMLYELLLKNGKDLNSHIEHKDGYYAINGKELVLMLDSSLTRDIVDAIIALHPEKVIVLDRLFKGNNPLKSNTALQVRGAGIEFRTI